MNDLLALWVIGCLFFIVVGLFKIAALLRVLVDEVRRRDEQHGYFQKW